MDLKLKRSFFLECFLEASSSDSSSENQPNGATKPQSERDLFELVAIFLKTITVSVTMLLSCYGLMAIK